MSSWSSAARPPVAADGELRGADHALVLEVEEQAVAARAGHLDRERDLRAGVAVLGVDVEVGQVALAQRVPSKIGLANN